MQRLFFTGFLLMCCFGLQAQNLDLDYLTLINQNGSSFKDNYFKTCSDAVPYVDVATHVSLLSAGLIKHDKKLVRQGLFELAGSLSAGVITQATKRLVNRPRPFQKYGYIIKRDTESGGYSFPSGHTSSAFYTATWLSINYPKWYVYVPAYIYAGSVGWARMYQGVHYPSDVLAGALVGIGAACATSYLQKKFEGRKKPVSKNLTENK